MRLRAARHEPALDGAVPPTVACPHCVALLSTTTTVAAKAPSGMRDDVENGRLVLDVCSSYAR